LVLVFGFLVFARVARPDFAVRLLFLPLRWRPRFGFVFAGMRGLLLLLLSLASAIR
jgi:hypothetical protein